MPEETDRKQQAAPNAGGWLNALASYIDRTLEVLTVSPAAFEAQGQAPRLQGELRASHFLVLSLIVAGLCLVVIETVDRGGSLADIPVNVSDAARSVLLVVPYVLTTLLIIGPAARLSRHPLTATRAFELISFSTAICVISWVVTPIWVMVLREFHATGEGHPLEPAPVFLGYLASTVWTIAAAANAGHSTRRRFIAAVVFMVLVWNIVTVGALFISRGLVRVGPGPTASLNANVSDYQWLHVSKGQSAPDAPTWTSMLSVAPGDTFGVRVVMRNSSAAPARNVDLMLRVADRAEDGVLDIVALLGCSTCDRVGGNVATVSSASGAPFGLVLLHDSVLVYEGPEMRRANSVSLDAEQWVFHTTLSSPLLKGGPDGVRAFVLQFVAAGP